MPCSAEIDELAEVERAEVRAAVRSRSAASGRSILLGTRNVCVYDSPTSSSSRYESAASRVLVGAEPVEHVLALLDAVVAAQVDQQQRQVGRRGSARAGADSM